MIKNNLDMEKFDLEKYSTGNYDVVTRDGHPVRILCTDRKINNDYNIVALIPDRFDCESVYYYSSEGKGFSGNIIKYDDLMLIKKQWKPKNGEQFYYINPTMAANICIYDDACLTWMKDLILKGNCFKTKEEAEEKIDKILEILNE